MPAKNENNTTMEVQARFFEAMNTAIQLGRIRGVDSFCKKHGLNRTKYVLLRSHRYDIYKWIDIAALAAICEDCNVSPTWLLLGKGKMMSADD